MPHFTRIHMRGAVLLFMGLCIETNAFVPLLLPATSRRVPCRAPPLRVAMQFQSASSARRRELDFKMPKSKPLPAKREPEGLLEDDPSLPVVEDIIRALDERKAEGIWAVRVSHLTYSTEFFVNCHGTSRPMLQALAGNVEDMMLEKYDRPIKWQGNPDSGWILLDYGEVIVNVMTEQAREFYDLEDHWGNGELIPLEGLVTPLDESARQRMSASFDFVDDEDWGAGGVDPFAEWDKLDANVADAEEELNEEELAMIREASEEEDGKQ